MGERRKTQLEKHCDMCGDVGNIKDLVICSLCNEAAEHIYCMQIQLYAVPDEWFCEACSLNRKAVSLKPNVYASENHPKTPPVLPSVDRLCHCNTGTKPLSPPKTIEHEALPSVGAGKLHQDSKMRNPCGKRKTIDISGSEVENIQRPIKRSLSMKSPESAELSDDDKTKLSELMKVVSAQYGSFNMTSDMVKKENVPVTGSPGSPGSPSGKAVLLSRGNSFKSVGTAKVKFLHSEEVVSMSSGAKGKLFGAHRVLGSSSVSKRASATVIAGSKNCLHKANVNPVARSGLLAPVNDTPSVLSGKQSNNSPRSQAIPSSQPSHGVKSPLCLLFKPSESERLMTTNIEKNGLVTKLLPVKAEIADTELPAREKGNLTTETERRVDEAKSKLLQVKEETIDTPVPAVEIGNLNTKKEKPVAKASDSSLLPMDSLPGCAADTFPGYTEVKKKLDAHQKLPPHKSSEVSAGKLLNLPTPYALWKGTFEILDMVCDCHFYDGIQAHPPGRVSRKAVEITKRLPKNLQFGLVPRDDIWPKPFLTAPPTDDDIALYFLPAELDRSKDKYICLLEHIVERDLAMRNCFDGVELLIFTSKQLPLICQRLNMQIYLWGVFCPKTNGPAYTSPESFVSCLNAIPRKNIPTDHVPSHEIISQNQVYMARGDNGDIIDMEIDMVGGIEVGRIDKPMLRPSLPASGFSSHSLPLPLNARKPQSDPSAQVDSSGMLISKHESLSVAIKSASLGKKADDLDIPFVYSEPTSDIPPGFSKPMSDIPPAFPELLSFKDSNNLSGGLQYVGDVSAIGNGSLKPAVSSGDGFFYYQRKKPVTVSKLRVPSKCYYQVSDHGPTSSSQTKDVNREINSEMFKIEERSLRKTESEKVECLGITGTEIIKESCKNQRHHYRGTGRDFAEEIERTEESFRRKEEWRVRFSSASRNESFRDSSRSQRHRSDSERGTGRDYTEEIERTERYRKIEQRREKFWDIPKDERYRDSSRSQRHHSESELRIKRGTGRDVAKEIERPERSIKTEWQSERSLDTSRNRSFRERSRSLRHCSENESPRRRDWDRDVAEETGRREGSFRKMEQQRDRSLSLSRDRSYRESSQADKKLFTETGITKGGSLSKMEGAQGILGTLKHEISGDSSSPKGRSGEQASGEVAKATVQTEASCGEPDRESMQFRGIDGTELNFSKTVHEKNRSFVTDKTENSDQMTWERNGVIGADKTKEKSIDRIEEDGKKFLDVPMHERFEKSSQHPGPCSESRLHILREADKVVFAKETAETEGTKEIEGDRKKILDMPLRECFLEISQSAILGPCSEGRSHIRAESIRDAAAKETVATEEEMPIKTEQKENKFLDAPTRGSFTKTSQSSTPCTESWLRVPTEASDGFFPKPTGKAFNEIEQENNKIPDIPRGESFSETTQLPKPRSENQLLLPTEDDKETVTPLESFKGNHQNLKQTQLQAEASRCLPTEDDKEVATPLETFKGNHQTPRQAQLQARASRCLQLFPMEAETRVQEVDTKKLDFDLELGIGRRAPNKISGNWESALLSLSTTQRAKEGKDSTPVAKKPFGEGDGWGDKVKLSL